MYSEPRTMKKIYTVKLVKTRVTKERDEIDCIC